MQEWCKQQPSSPSSHWRAWTWATTCWLPWKPVPWLASATSDTYTSHTTDSLASIVMYFMVSKPSYALFSEPCEWGRGTELNFTNSESMVVCGNEWSHSHFGHKSSGKYLICPNCLKSSLTSVTTDHGCRTY